MKRGCFIGSILVVLLACHSDAADYAGQVRADAPVAWWRFADDSSGEGNTAKDETGAHTGTYHGPIELAPDGPWGNACARFDGKSGYLSIPNDPAFALNALSVECWFKTAQRLDNAYWPGSATLVSKATAGDSSGDWTLVGASLAPGKNQGRVIAGTGPSGGPQDKVIASPGRLNDGNWHHVVWTREADGTNLLYVDGRKVATGRDGSGSIANDRPIHIGGDAFLEGGTYLDGSMAEVAVYAHVLTAERVKAHFDASQIKGNVMDNTEQEHAEKPIETLRIANDAGLCWEFERHTAGWALGTILLNGKPVDTPVTAGMLFLRNTDTDVETWLPASEGAQVDSKTARFHGQGRVPGSRKRLPCDDVTVLFEVEVALDPALPVASLHPRWSVDRELTGYEMCLAYQGGFASPWRCQLYPFAGNSEAVACPRLEYCGVPAALLYRPDLSLAVLYGMALSFDYLNPTTWTGATGFHFQDSITPPQFRVGGGTLSPGVDYELPLQIILSDVGESAKAISNLVRAWIQTNHYEVEPLEVRAPEEALRLFMEGRRHTDMWYPKIGYRLQQAPGVNFVYLGTTPASAYLEYRLYERTGDTIWRDRCFEQMDFMMKAQNLDAASLHYGALHTTYELKEETFNSYDRGANRGWKPDINAHMIRYMLLTWERVKQKEGLDRKDWFETASRAGQWLLRQQNPDGGMPQVIVENTGQPSNSVVCGRTLAALPTIARITSDKRYDECLGKMETFLRTQVEGRFWFTGSHPDLWPNDYEQDSVWSVVEFWLDRYDRTGENECIERAAADAYQAFLWWCPKQLSWVRNPTQCAHAEQQHYLQYSIYCYHNRKLQCLDRLARKTNDPLWAALARRVMQANFYTQAIDGNEQGAFHEAIADPWLARANPHKRSPEDFNFQGTLYMNELSLDMMLQLVDTLPAS